MKSCREFVRILGPNQSSKSLEDIATCRAGEAGAPDGIEQWCSEVLCNVRANDVQYTVY